jgi:hypothetical protein
MIPFDGVALFVGSLGLRCDYDAITMRLRCDYDAITMRL